MVVSRSFECEPVKKTALPGLLLCKEGCKMGEKESCKSRLQNKEKKTLLFPQATGSARVRLLWRGELAQMPCKKQGVTDPPPDFCPTSISVPTYAVLRTCHFFAMLLCMQLCSEAPSRPHPKKKGSEIHPFLTTAGPQLDGRLLGRPVSRGIPPSPQYLLCKGGCGPRALQTLQPCAGPHHFPLRSSFGGTPPRPSPPGWEAQTLLLVFM